MGASSSGGPIAADEGEDLVDGALAVVGAGGPDPAAHAVAQVGAQEVVLQAAERVDGGAELEEDLVAGAFLLEHPGDAAHLPLDPPEAGLVVVAGGNGPLRHGR